MNASYDPRRPFFPNTLVPLNAVALRNDASGQHANKVLVDVKNFAFIEAVCPLVACLRRYDVVKHRYNDGSVGYAVDPDLVNAVLFTCTRLVRVMLDAAGMSTLLSPLSFNLR